MKTKLSFIIAFITISVLTVCLDNVSASTNGSFFIFRNNADLYYQNLDSRDENNNPVIDQNSKNILENLFVFGYYDLLINAEIYSFAQSLAMLKKALNPSDIAFNLPSFESVKNLISIIMLSVKKFLGNILFAVSNLFVMPLVYFSMFVICCSLFTLHPSLFTEVMRC
jgi:hypothetical protein